MAEAKTKPGALSVADFLNTVDPARLAETRRLIDIFHEVSGYAPQVWATIIGFGRYAYHYESGTKGESLATGFAPRKAEIVLYGLATGPDQAAPLAALGKHRLGKACLYLKSLSGVDEAALRTLIRAGLDDLAQRWPIHPA